MKLDTNFDALILTIGELSFLARQPGSAENILSLVPKLEIDGKEAVLAEFAKIDKAQRDDYVKAMAMLLAPSQVARVNYSIADETVTRIYLAWRPETRDSVAALALTDGQFAVSLQPADKIERMLGNALAVNAVPKPANLTRTLTANTAIVLIAVMDYFRYGRYLSMLTHIEPPTSFSRQEVMERLEDAAAEDFRWPLLMLDKVFPVPIAGRFKAEGVTAGLEELCK